MAKNITVTFDDGSEHVYSNVPDNVTAEQATARATKDFSKPITHIARSDSGKIKPVETKEQSAIDKFNNFNKEAVQQVKNGLGGMVRGAGSIGASLLAPYDMANNDAEKAAALNPLSASLLIAKKAATGELSLDKNKQRRSDMDSGLSDMGVDTNSLAFNGGKLAAEIAGTAGAGEAIAPIAGAGKLANAIRSGGMNLGTTDGSMLANGATRVAGGAINGAAQAGMIDPESAPSGAVVGGALPAIAVPSAKLGKTIGSAIAPFYQGGKNKIIADYLLSKSGNNTNEVIRNLENAKGATAGFNPTTGQASNSADLATLERTMKARNSSLFQDVDQNQRKALADAIRNLGGDDVARQGLVDAREQATNELYNTAKAKSLPVDDTLNSLLQRPAISQAAKEAEINALNRGVKLTTIVPSDSTAVSTELGGKNKFVDGQSLHEVKMALDAARNHNAVGGANKAQLGAIGDAAGDFNSYLENAIPEYGLAKNTYKELSQPINQLDLGNKIVDSYIPASERDLPIPTQLKREQLAKILHDNGDKLATHVTGFKGATLKNTLRPDQIQAIQNAVKDGQLMTQGEMLGKGGGSDTFQKLAFNGMGEQSGIVGKLLNSAPSNVIKSVRDFAYTAPNKQLEQQLAEALLNPKDAANLMKGRLTGANKNEKLAELLISLARTAPVLTTSNASP